jgi:hypothetical protein
MTHEFFIVVSAGYFGKGATLEAARRAWKGVGGRKTRQGKVTEFRFTSELPFAPMDRKANDGEADAWINSDGSLWTTRCETHRLTPDVGDYKGV